MVNCNIANLCFYHSQLNFINEILHLYIDFITSTDPFNQLQSNILM